MNSSASRFVVVALVFALYAATMCRWIGAGDTAIVVWNMDQMILSSHVNNHPAMVAIGSLLMKIPFGSPAWRANLFSLIFTTLYVGMFHAIVSRWLKDPLHAALSAFILAVTHAVWWHATIVENYALNGVTLLTVTWMLIKDHETRDIRWLYGAGVVAGLAVFNHAQMGFLAPVLGMYGLVRDEWNLRRVLQRWALLAAAWLVGLTPFLALLVRNITKGHNSQEVVKNAVGSHFTAIMFDLRLWELGTVFWQEILVQFPSPVLILLPFGIWYSLRRKSERWAVHAALGAGFAVNSGFFMLYHTWDRFAFLLPSFIILQIWLSEAWAGALQWSDEKRPSARWLILAVALVGVGMPPLVYRELPRLGRAGLFWHGRFSSNSQWNTHDVATYLANPDKSQWSDLERLNELLIEKLPARAVVVDDDGRNHYTLELYFQKVLNKRRDIRARLVNAWGFDGWGQDKATLADRILGWRKSGRIFGMTLMPPHRKWQDDLANHGLGPVPFYLADDVWIYEFTERPRGNAEPFLWEVQTGLRLRSGSQVLTHRIGPEDPGQLRIRYRPIEDGVEHTVQLLWSGPGSAEIRADLVLDAGERAVGPMPPEVLATPGDWRVDVMVEGQRDVWVRFVVEEQPVDRRFR